MNEKNPRKAGRLIYRVCPRAGTPEVCWRVDLP
jgi:hypothetical protein